jgi:hypothetical protein
VEDGSAKGPDVCVARDLEVAAAAPGCASLFVMRALLPGAFFETV